MGWTTVLSVRFALAVMVAPRSAGARRKGKELMGTPSTETFPKYNVCFYAVAGTENEFVPSLFKGDVPRAVRFGSGDFRYDRSQMYRRPHFRNGKKGFYWRDGKVGEETNRACDAFLAIWQIPHSGSNSFVQRVRGGGDVRKMLPENIVAKSVTVGFVEDCTKVTQVRGNGSLDAVWYHNARADPETLLNLPLGPAYTMEFTSEQTAMQHLASGRKYFYNIVMSLSTGQDSGDRSKRMRWQVAHERWSKELVGLTAGSSTKLQPAPSNCSFSAITRKWETPDSKNAATEAGETEAARPTEAENIRGAVRSRKRRTMPPPDRVRRDCPRASGGGKISQQEYRSVLLDSAFTLAPAGHNIECYRIWEAAEAGSIPVLIVNETSVNGGNVTETGCSLHPDVMKAPFLWASDLPDAWRQMRTLGEHKREFNARSHAVRLWYKSYMKITISRFERLLLRAVQRGIAVA